MINRIKMVALSVRYIAKEYLNRLINFRHSLSLATNPRHDDVYLVSFPKSGNTWLDFLIANVNIQISKSSESVTFYNIHRYVPDIHDSRDIGPPALDFPRFRIIKSHSSFNPYYKNVVYIVRHPFDVMVSYFHFQKDLGNYNGTLSQFIRSDIYGIRTWTSHVKAWMKDTPASLPFIYIRYEDLKENAGSEIRKIYKHFGFDLSEYVISRAFELSSFKNMKLLENEYGYGGRPIVKKFNFMRKGEIGYAENVLSNDDKKYVIRHAREAMELLGYL